MFREHLGHPTGEHHEGSGGTRATGCPPHQHDCNAPLCMDAHAPQRNHSVGEPHRAIHGGVLGGRSAKCCPAVAANGIHDKDESQPPPFFPRTPQLKTPSQHSTQTRVTVFGPAPHDPENRATHRVTLVCRHQRPPLRAAPATISRKLWRLRTTGSLATAILRPLTQNTRVANSFSWMISLHGAKKSQTCGKRFHFRFFGRSLDGLLKKNDKLPSPLS